MSSEPAVKRVFRLSLGHDDDCESPETFDSSWTLYRFEDPKHCQRFEQRYLPEKRVNLALRRKLAVGTAFWVSLYRHSGDVWSLFGEGPTWDRQWDYTYYAGCVVWEHPVGHLGPKKKAERAEDARIFLEEYNAWCNGRCFYYAIKGMTDEGPLQDCCSGFIGDKYFMEEVKRVLEEYGIERVVVEGEAADLAEHYNLGVEVVDARDVVEEVDLRLR